ncbi:DUF4065 domain-containing protein [soil metagenome]
MHTALDIAKYFLSKSDAEAGDLISNLKLQKLLYYSQGLHLALYGKPLFNEDIEAWTHGPVVPVIYRHFKGYGDGGIPSPATLPKFDKKTTGFLDEIYKVFGQFSAWKLRNLTHDEPPWKETRQSNKITHKALSDYFKTQLE